MPELTIYCMSKHAIRSFSDGLRRELYKSNVKVIMIEPAMYKTPITDWKAQKNIIDSVWNQTPIEVQKYFEEEWRQLYEERTEAYMSFGRKQTKEVVDAMINAIILVEPKPYYWCGGFVDLIIVWLFSLAPESIQDFVFNFIVSHNLLHRIHQQFRKSSENKKKYS